MGHRYQSAFWSALLVVSVQSTAFAQCASLKRYIAEAQHERATYKLKPTNTMAADCAEGNKMYRIGQAEISIVENDPRHCGWNDERLQHLKDTSQNLASSSLQNCH